MTLTVKNPADTDSPSKPGAPSQNTEKKTGPSPRSNPVCLETGVTIRSLPNESGGQDQPVREEGRTVIVFDNGAVLRASSNLTAGRTVILSNAHGRDVVCRVAGGRNLPSVKGYVEVEFIEPVNDFWGIHQNGAPPPAGSATASAAPLEPPARPVQPSPANETFSKLQESTRGSSRPFDGSAPDASAAPYSPAIRESRPELPASALGIQSKPSSDYSHAAVAQPDSIANWQAPDAAPPATTLSIAAPRQHSSQSSDAPVPNHDFMSKGLMAYNQPDSGSGAAAGRAPLIVGVAALALAGICAAVLLTHRKAAPVVPVASQASASPSSPAASNPVAPVPQTLDQAVQAAANQPDAQASASPQLLEVDPVPAAAAATPVPASITSSLNADSKIDSKGDAKADSRSARKQERAAVAPKPAPPAAERRPVIANLKMSTPTAPNKNSGDASDTAASVTEIAANEPVAVPPAGLLTSAGRTSSPPTPPPSAPAPPAISAPKVVRDPKLISSVRPSYPATAKQSNIQGSVTVSATVDVNGRVTGATALSGPILLRQPAVDSVKQWKYAPGTVDGKPSPSQVTVSVEFRLN